MIKSYTDLEQSRKLAEILPLESADMWHRQVIGGYELVTFYSRAGTFIPAWSLAALLNVLPVIATLIKDGTIANIGDVKYSCECSMVNIHKWFDNPVDACVSMIEKLNELKLL